MNAVNLEKIFVGFDKLVNSPLYLQQSQQSTPDYPRYNIENIDDGYIIYVAVPGWSKDQISVNVHKNILVLTL